MTCSDTTMRQGSAAFLHRGTGHVSGWQFAICMNPKILIEGRRKLTVRGGKQWVCPACVRARDAQKACA